ncbi:uncharacterized protein MELLADRAFT_104988 [Melampsora larici-populina 98AG31]|uniref:Uncharacterized protein n=1 Tax=Melampsora larici-populina (strain 98AG31 / pathotype 3-4-7) TaxID=747676 RepID=F4RG51_MELLP|nr:uncharacterized protein MELLADRAFT_104988 [Melampsora larici-populina 98AG31]EGG08547.1 hypothetical protein MELLADRAFT_104988 [Melampsora larici-populina 98AG31]
MAENWVNQNRDVTEGLQALLKEYDEGGGSGAYEMATLRAAFANWIPFDHEFFHRHFSMFATEAVAMDLRANRFCYPIGGIPPDPSVPIGDTPPYIQPTQLLQNVQHFGERNRQGGQEGEGEVERREGEGGGDQRERNEERREDRNNESREENRRRKRDRRSREDNSSSDESQSGTQKNKNHVWSFIKNKNNEDQPLPQEALDMNKLIKEYRDNNLFDAVFNFVWYSGKSHNFPDALVQDLLQYKFIDLEKINAGPITPNFSLASRSKDSDPAAKIKPKPFVEATEWRDAVFYLVESLSLAFGCAEESFKKYEKHLRIMERTFRERGNWRDVIPYDIALRQAFATRRHLSFADYASDELSHLKHLALADKEKYRGNSTYDKSYAHTSPQVPRASSSRFKSDKKPKMEHPWAGKVKDTKNLPICQQLCGGWNLNKCHNDKCPSGRIHNMCDFINCYESHKRITHKN